jgi:hypothetical protein
MMGLEGVTRVWTVEPANPFQIADARACDMASKTDLRQA